MLGYTQDKDSNASAKGCCTVTTTAHSPFRGIPNFQNNPNYPFVSHRKLSLDRAKRGEDMR